MTQHVHFIDRKQGKAQDSLRLCRGRLDCTQCVPAAKYLLLPPTLLISVQAARCSNGDPGSMARAQVAHAAATHSACYCASCCAVHPAGVAQPPVLLPFKGACSCPNAQQQPGGRLGDASIVPNASQCTHAGHGAGENTPMPARAQTAVCVPGTNSRCELQSRARRKRATSIQVTAFSRIYHCTSCTLCTS